MLPVAKLGLRGGAVALGCSTVLAALLSLYTITMPLLVGETIAHSRDILTAFKLADRNIKNYRFRTGKLPTSDQVNSNGGSAYQVSLIDPSINQYADCCQDALRLLGIPPRDSYLLEVWRGEWSEYYAPWSGRSTLSFDRNDYAMTGSLLADAVLSVVLMIALGYGTLRVWKAGKGSADGL